MADKILVADDSLTIQKVVAITLANEPWVLVEATDDAELFGKLRGGGFRLVLLDFNLSESKSGYELATEIKKISPQTAVMAMLGTFDTVEEAGLEQAGVDGRIVKPFDSHKFVQKCRDLIDGDAEETLSPAETASLDFSSSADADEDDDDDASEWVMDASQTSSEQEDSSDEVDTWDEDTSPRMTFDREESGNNSLESELEGWGVNVPDPISAEKSEISEIPPVISSSSNVELQWDEDENENSSPDLEFSVSEPLGEAEEFKIEKVGVEDEDTVYPQDGELDYPDLDFASDNSQASREVRSSLISLDQLSEDDSDDVLPLRLETKAEEKREDLAREIEDELSADDFWAVDDSESPSVSIESHHKSEDDDDRESFVVGVGDPRAPVEPVRPSNQPSLEVQSENTMTEFTQFDEDRIVEKVKVALGPMLEEIVRRYMDEKVEKVAWEIIPDVAENLIRKEIKELSQVSRDS